MNNNIKIGGGTSQTTLWTNPDSTSSLASGSITLSDDAENYDFLIIKYWYSASLHTYYGYVGFNPKVTQYASLFSSGINYAVPCGRAYKSSGADDYRHFAINSNDKTKLLHNVTDTRYVIPEYVIGVKNIDMD